MNENKFEYYYAVYYDGKVNGESINNACKYDDYFKALKFYKNLACTYMLIEDTDIQISLIEHTENFKSGLIDKYIKIDNV